MSWQKASKVLLITEFNIFGPSCQVLHTVALMYCPRRAESSLIFIIAHTLLLLFLSAKNKHHPVPHEAAAALVKQMQFSFLI